MTRRRRKAKPNGVTCVRRCDPTPRGSDLFPDETGPTADQFQVRVGQGEIEYGKVIDHLDRLRYNRTLAVDVLDTINCEFPVEPEVRKLKYLLESLCERNVGAPAA